MSGVKFVKIESVDDGIRLNRWFMREYPSLTLSRLQKLLRTKQIKVDGKKAETSTRLLEGQELRIPPLDNEKKIIETNNQLKQKDIEFMLSLVIYKDDNIIAINKPSGLAVQGGTNTFRHVDGLLDALKFESNEKPKLVHRIDKDTSGILVLARTRKIADVLTKAFREHALQKTYLALCLNSPKQKYGEISAPLEKHGEKMLVDENGKKAITKYKVLDEVGNKFCLIEAQPLTGRTHQIRAHLEHIGCPIVGDEKYFGENREKFDNLSNKLHLHAYKIEIPDIYKKVLCIWAPLPDNFRQDLDNIGISFVEHKK